jgi:sugar lactone lactonase YvrE
MKRSVVLLAAIGIATVTMGGLAWALDPPAFVLKWSTGTSSSDRPTGIGVDADGNVYVAAAGNNCIRKYTRDGTLLLEWGTAGSGDGQFNWPRDVFPDATGNVFVTDGYNHRVQKFSGDGTFLLEWGSQGTGDGQFYLPNGVYVDHAGDVYVTCGYHSSPPPTRIQKFAGNGTYILKWGSHGSGNGQFYNPTGVAMDSEWNVYVSDFRNYRIQKFTHDGTFLAKWGTPGSGNGQFNRPIEVEVDENDHVYVADQQNNRIQVFDTDGTFLTKWGSYGSGPGQFYHPWDIAVDACGNVFVADHVNCRIQRFALATANTAPVVTISDPSSGSLFPVGVPVDFAGAFADEDGDVHTAEWTCGDIVLPGDVDETSKIVTASHAFESAGVYLVTLTVTDQCGGSGTATTVGDLDAMIVVYDPSAGFVTGGGWIDSPSGAYVPAPTITGKASFGFVSKYRKGATTPTGQTEFRFKTADMNFHSTEYQWLVIAGARAQYKGLGTINGGGNYGFMLTAIDGDLKSPVDPDKFRMKIVDKDQDDVVVYDNQMGGGVDDDPVTTLGGGSIVIHSSPGGGSGTSAQDDGDAPDPIVSLPVTFALLQNQPNPFNPTTQIGFELPASVSVSLAVYDVSGRLVKHLVDATIPAGRHVVNWDGRNGAGQAVATGVYFYRIQAGRFTDTRRMVLLK